MAAVQQQATLEDRFCNEDFKNWLKAVLCLFCVKEGLESFVTQESVALHRIIVVKSRLCENCTQDNLKTPSKLCSQCSSQFKKEIKKQHVKKPIWSNTDEKSWFQEHWSVAKCFMNHNQSNHASAADADISALLNFINNYKEFSDRKTYGNIQVDADTVRKHRNNLIHRGKDTLKKKDFDEWTKDMIHLLNNGKLKDNDMAKKAVTDISQILNEDFTITLKNENKVKIAYLEAQMEQAKKQLEKVQKDSTSQGQKVETLTKDVDTIQAKIEKIQKSMDEVRKQLTLTDVEVSDITSGIKYLFKAIWDQLQQCVESLENPFETLKNEKSKTKTTELSNIQCIMIKSYKPHLTIQINPVVISGRTSRDLGDFYTNIILEKEHEKPQEAKRETQHEKPEQIKSFRQLFWKANVPIYRIALKGKAGLGKSTFLKLLLKTWCTFHDSKLNELVRSDQTKKKSSDLKHGDVMEKFDILLFVNLSKIQNEKDIIDVIDKQIPCLDHHKLPPNYLHDLMGEPHDNKVLMLMDGLDEMDGKAPSMASIEQIIKGELYPTMTVIVASRPWNIDKLQQSDPPASFALMIDMKGFSEKSSKLFAEKILNKTDIKQFWDEVSRNDIAKTLIHIPILMLFLVQVWHKEKSFPQTVTHLYLKMLDIIGERYKEKTKEKRKDAPINDPVENIKTFPKLQNLAITKIIGEKNLLAWCNIAYHFLIDGKQESPLKDDKGLDHHGNDDELKWQLALDIGLVSQEDCTEGDDDSRKVSVSFTHRTIQELLAAISVCCDKENINNFLDRLETYHDVIQNETIITFIAGISHQSCEKIFETICETCDDQQVYKDKEMAANLCRLFLKCVREAEKSSHFRLKHICIKTSDELHTIVPSIKNIQDIRTLNLQHVDFTSENSKECLSILECDNLVCLELRDIKLNEIDWKWLKSPGLLSLVIDDVTMSCRSSSELLCDTLSQCTKLRKLRLELVKLGDDKIDLKDNSCSSTLGLKNVTISSLILSKCTNLEQLVLCSVKLGDEKLDLDNSCLSELVLIDVTISSVNLSKCTNLKQLTVLQVKLGDMKMDIVHHCLSQLYLQDVTVSSLNLSKCAKLRRLTLTDVKIGDNRLDLPNGFYFNLLSMATNLHEQTLNTVDLDDGILTLDWISP